MFTPTLKLEHADARGEIYSITLPGDKELLLIHSVKDSLRGGHAHSVSEVVVMLEGGMRYYKKHDESAIEQYTLVHGGDASFNERGLFHMGEFVSDSWLLEWKIGTKRGAWKNFDDPTWRERVKANSIS